MLALVIQKKLQRLIIYVEYNFCNRWKLKANVNKRAVIAFSRDIVNGDWMWEVHKLPNVTNYTFLGSAFSYNGTSQCN